MTARAHTALAAAVLLVLATSRPPRPIERVVPCLDALSESWGRADGHRGPVEAPRHVRRRQGLPTDVDR